MPRIRFRRSAPAAPIPASRTRKTWRGSSPLCSKGEAAGSLIESYDLERLQAADENIGNSTRSTDFMSPHSSAERRLRDAVLALAPKAEFARRLGNSRRLSGAAV